MYSHFQSTRDTIQNLLLPSCWTERANRLVIVVPPYRTVSNPGGQINKEIVDTAAKKGGRKKEKRSGSKRIPVLPAPKEYIEISLIIRVIPRGDTFPREP